MQETFGNESREVGERDVRGRERQRYKYIERKHTLEMLLGSEKQKRFCYKKKKIPQTSYFCKKLSYFEEAKGKRTLQCVLL